jgi:hypothetical protein
MLKPLACLAVFFAALFLVSPSLAQANRQILNQSIATLNLDTAPESRTVVPQGYSQLTLSSQDRRSLQRISGGRLDFTCNGDYCICRGEDDCIDMFNTNACGPHAICFGSYCFCDRASQ